MHHMFRSLVLAAALFAVAPLALQAESAPADAAAPAATMPCPHADGGACCGGACMDQQKQAAADAPAAAAESGGCPCQRARQEAARKAAEAAKQN